MIVAGPVVVSAQRDSVKRRGCPTSRRPRLPLRLIHKLIMLLFWLLVPAAASRAQEPADTTPRPRPDTVQQVVQDTVKPIPQLALHFLGPAAQLSNGVWQWDQSALLLEATTTLADLLERIPSINIIRTGLQLQPEAATAFGGTANRVEVWLDGYILDPMTESSVDLSKIELANLASVRIERRIGLIRIHLETLVPLDNRAYTRIEAGVGEPESNLFRGVLLAPKLFFGPFGVGIDRIDTDGLSRREPADQFAGWIKWSYVRGQSGFNIEYRRMSTDRDDVIPWPAEHSRDDVVARVRLNIRAGLVAEAFAGRTTFVNDTADINEAEDTIPKIEAATVQWGGRASFNSPLAWAHGAIRFRDHEALAAMQIDVSGGLRYRDFAAVSAELTQADWRTAGSASWVSLHAQVTPISGVRAFGELTIGTRGAPFLYDTASNRAVLTNQSGYRAGAELSWRGISIGAALLHTENDSAAVFGLPFDSTTRVFGGSFADGIELNATVPLFLRGLSGYGMLTDWRSGSLGFYLPVRQYRVGLQYHNSPLRSGNLELYGRIEAVHRGTMIVPFGDMPADDRIDAYVQIRIIDVRLFGRFYDIMGQGITDVRGRTIAGPRIFYGVKWNFWN